MLYEWLRDYQKLEEEIDYLEYKLEREKKELRRWEVGDLCNVKLQEKSIASNLENVIYTIEWQLAQKMNDQHDARKLIKRFKGLDNRILYGKYVEGKTLSDIALELSYSYNYVKSKHAEAMRIIKFADKLIM